MMGRNKPLPKQSISMAIILHLLTGGIYGLYWFYSRSKLLRPEKPDAHKYVNAALGLLLLLLMSVVLLGFLPKQHGFWYLPQILQIFGLPIVVGIYVFMALAAI
ncbi:DUF4234 domain-containing protein [bacterium]|nr:DUF4234 domain-containing protein [bacterium]